MWSLLPGLGIRVEGSEQLRPFCALRAALERGLSEVMVAYVGATWQVKRMITGRATKLESQFRLIYTMILNLMRVEDLKVRTRS